MIGGTVPARISTAIWIFVAKYSPSGHPNGVFDIDEINTEEAHTNPWDSPGVSHPSTLHSSPSTSDDELYQHAVNESRKYGGIVSAKKPPPPPPPSRATKPSAIAATSSTTTDEA
jgi:hypothetical protein